MSQKCYQFFINERLKKISHFFTSILPNYVPHEITKEFFLTFYYFLVDCAHGSLIENGFCNDQSNNALCIYDGGDCCGECVNTDNCLNCVCHAESTILQCKLSHFIQNQLLISKLKLYEIEI